MPPSMSTPVDPEKSVEVARHLAGQLLYLESYRRDPVAETAAYANALLTKLRVLSGLEPTEGARPGRVCRGPGCPERGARPRGGRAGG